MTMKKQEQRKIKMGLRNLSRVYEGPLRNDDVGHGVAIPISLSAVVMANMTAITNTIY